MRTQHHFHWLYIILLHYNGIILGNNKLPLSFGIKLENPNVPYLFFQHAWLCHRPGLWCSRRTIGMQGSTNNLYGRGGKHKRGFHEFAFGERGLFARKRLTGTRCD